MIRFDTIVSAARARAELSGAEFDYSLHARDGIALGALANAAYELANAHLPTVTPGHGDLAQREANANALIEATRPDREARIAAATARSYTGWSTASHGPISYAR